MPVHTFISPYLITLKQFIAYVPCPTQCVTERADLIHPCASSAKYSSEHEQMFRHSLQNASFYNELEDYLI